VESSAVLIVSQPFKASAAIRSMPVPTIFLPFLIEFLPDEYERDIRVIITPGVNARSLFLLSINPLERTRRARRHLAQALR
jgi:hypothetical protein